MMDDIRKNLLLEIAGLHGIPEGAYNSRSDSKSIGRASTANIEIVPKTDKDGIDIIIKPGTKNEAVHIPVIIAKAGVKENVYNDFFVGEAADVTIVAGCGIHCGGDDGAEHDGIHSFHLAKGARVKYVERHYGEGDGKGTSLEVAHEGLEILGVAGSDKAREFAEIVACTVLAGELSLVGALAAGHLARAHQELGRG